MFEQLRTSQEQLARLSRLHKGLSAENPSFVAYAPGIRKMHLWMHEKLNFFLLHPQTNTFIPDPTHLENYLTRGSLYVEVEGENRKYIAPGLDLLFGLSVHFFKEDKADENFQRPSDYFEQLLQQIEQYKEANGYKYCIENRINPSWVNFWRKYFLSLREFSDYFEFCLNLFPEMDKSACVLLMCEKKPEEIVDELINSNRIKETERKSVLGGFQKNVFLAKLLVAGSVAAITEITEIEIQRKKYTDFENLYKKFATSA